ncbi:chromosome segregation protein SMC [Limosilactobacillus gastricus]|nr:chromosome segregation protein SMC [Limosilactobacillus gastricus]QGF40583.1 chromosome segregation protein SMC [Limosilactobacillus gastricus]
MRLLSLEIEGFKSFAQKTKIEFQPGMNGIIGPNGSGKSNIIEAIRWVMGEQSAKTLRGDKMADVIFNGSTDRKPLNRAQVKITFDNSDHYLQSEFTELTVTRRLYRNGDSEYLINDHAVRLKDIVELFMDSGIGRESFSIISQGRVAEIFNGKPSDRRTVIEDVAGVSKYKQNKQVAEKRLAETNDNLNRVNDIITEIKDRLEPLAEQSALAQDYLEQKTRLDLLDRTQTVRSILTKRQQLGTVQDQLAHAKATSDHYETETKSANEHLLVLRETYQRQLKAKDEHQQQVLSLTELIAKLNGEQSLSSVRQEQREQEISRLQTAIHSLKDQIAALQKKLGQDQETITKQSQQLANDQVALKAAQSLSAREQVAQLESEIETKRSQLVDLMQEQTSVQNQQQFLKRNHQRDSDQQAQADTDLKNLQEQYEEANRKAQAQHQQVAASQAKLDQISAKLQAEQAQAQTIQQRYEQISQQWYQALGEVKSAQNRIQGFRSMAADYTGYYQGVQYVLKNRQHFSGLFGSVSELIQVAPQYTTAIETVLGGQLQQLVVDTQATGKAIINFLVQQRAGRVTILPMDNLRPGWTPKSIQQVQTLPGFIGQASELIQYQDQYKGVVAHLLSTTVVADNLDHATTIAKAGQHQLRVVTLDGQLINASGAMTGGANRRQRTGLLQQKEQLAQLETVLKKTQANASELEHQVQSIQTAREQNQAVLTKLQEEQNQLQNAHQTLVTEAQVSANELTSLKRQLTSLEFTVNQQNSQSQNYQSQLEQLDQDYARLSQEITDHQTAIQQMKDQINDLQQNANSQAERIQDLMQRTAVGQERLNQLKSQQNVDQVQLADYEQSQADYQNQLDQLESSVQAQADEVENSQAALQKATVELTDQQALVEKLSMETDAMAEQIENETTQLDRLQGLQRVAMNELSTLSGQQAKLEAQIDQGLNRLSERYSMSLTDAQANLSELDDDELARQIKLLNRGIAELGEVNTASIAEYEEVKTRYDFLASQQADLLESRAQLDATMSEMDREVATRFIKTFEEVSTAFSATFKQIFAGGSAKLVLTDPDEPLTTGVDIIAQPPGKRNQNLSLLSGGEQALTAITLLFAIIQVRPVPFAILDEPEAALDAVNVDRFANYLSHFGDDGPQFIVITHRKGTMMNANILYGVTMQESGVSRMVAVDIDETLGQHQAE